MIDARTLLVTVPGASLRRALDRRVASRGGRWSSGTSPTAAGRGGTAHRPRRAAVHGRGRPLGALAGARPGSFSRSRSATTTCRSPAPDTSSRTRHPCTRRRPPSSPSPSCSLRNAASPTSCAPPPRGIGRPRGTEPRRPPGAAARLRWRREGHRGSPRPLRGGARAGRDPGARRRGRTHPRHRRTPVAASHRRHRHRRRAAHRRDDRPGRDAFLAALPDGALVVNIARGKVADTTRSSRRRRPADCGSRSTSPTPSRCPRGIRSSPCRTC